MPAFHAFMLVRDEGDILAQTIAHLLTWCDALHVLDTGSTDATWDIVREAASRDPRVRPFEHREQVMRIGLRGLMFEAARREYRRGDWIAYVDADEFYHVPPPVFVREHVAPREGRVFTQHYEFVILRSEMERWERGGVRMRTIPDICEDRTRYFVDDFMVLEARLFRFRPGMRWPIEHSNPLFPGVAAQARIPVRHYRWRSPAQIEQRLALRQRMAKISEHGLHWANPALRPIVVDDADPRLRTWSPSLWSRGVCEDLPATCDPRHMKHGWRALAQRGLYALGLPSLIDACSPRPSGRPRDDARGAQASQAPTQAV